MNIVLFYAGYELHLNKPNEVSFVVWEILARRNQNLMSSRLLHRIVFGLFLITSILIVKVNQGRAAVCGDLNASQQVDIADVVYLINYIFAG